MSDDDKYGYRIDPSGLNNCDRKSGPGPEAWDDSDSVDLEKPLALEITAINGYALAPEVQAQQLKDFIADAKRRLFENETGAYWLELMMAAPLPKKGNDE